MNSYDLEMFEYEILEKISECNNEMKICDAEEEFDFGTLVQLMHNKIVALRCRSAHFSGAFYALTEKGEKALQDYLISRHSIGALVGNDCVPINGITDKCF
tara:strand:- start:326 stop:628 length:303 start_codon:yes stop_codon:yes gene_type:complete